MARRRTHGEGRLMAATRALLKSTAVSYPDIFKATDITPNWLTRFAAGDIPDPGVNRVECLYSFLSGRSLEL